MAYSTFTGGAGGGFGSGNFTGQRPQRYKRPMQNRPVPSTPMQGSPVQANALGLTGQSSISKPGPQNPPLIGPGGGGGSGGIIQNPGGLGGTPAGPPAPIVVKNVPYGQRGQPLLQRGDFGQQPQQGYGGTGGNMPGPGGPVQPPPQQPGGFGQRQEQQSVFGSNLQQPGGLGGVVQGGIPGLGGGIGSANEQPWDPKAAEQERKDKKAETPLPEWFDEWKGWRDERDEWRKSDRAWDADFKRRRRIAWEEFSRDYSRKIWKPGMPKLREIQRKFQKQWRDMKRAEKNRRKLRDGSWRDRRPRDGYGKELKAYQEWKRLNDLKGQRWDGPQKEPDLTFEEWIKAGNRYKEPPQISPRMSPQGGAGGVGGTASNSNDFTGFLNRMLQSA